LDVCFTARNQPSGESAGVHVQKTEIPNAVRGAPRAVRQFNERAIDEEEKTIEPVGRHALARLAASLE
jgi:hypothetical protein